MAAITTKLITIADFLPYCQISESIPDEHIDPYILEAQEMDLMPIFGNAFWFDLISNPIATNYTKLLNGETYINSKDEEVYFNGLKVALVHFAYARYVIGSTSISTSFSFVQKTNDYSQPSDAKVLAQKSQAKKEAGNHYLKSCLDYLNNDDGTLFPKFKKSVTRQPARRGFTITAIDSSDPYKNRY